MTVTERKPQKSDLIDIVSCNLDRLEPGLTLFDSRLPTVLGHQIDILATDKNRQLTMILVFADKIPPGHSAREALWIYGRWNFICDFRDDFFAEARQREIELAPKPPRIMLLLPEVSPKLWPYLRWFRDSYIRTSVFLLEEPASTNGVKPTWRKADWPETKPLSRANLHRLNLDNAAMANEQRIIWKAMVGQERVLAGYDKDRSLAAARQRLLENRKGESNAQG
jgi:hypothetical protein